MNKLQEIAPTMPWVRGCLDEVETLSRLREEASMASAADRASRWWFVLDAIDAYEGGGELSSGTRLVLEGFIKADLPCTYGGGISKLLDAFKARSGKNSVSARHRRIAVFEAVGCALAVLRRIDHVGCDEDERSALTQVRSVLSVTQSKIRERIDG